LRCPRATGRKRRDCQRRFLGKRQSGGSQTLPQQWLTAAYSRLNGRHSRPVNAYRVASTQSDDPRPDRGRSSATREQHAHVEASCIRSSKARALPPLMSGTIRSSRALTPSRSVAYSSISRVVPGGLKVYCLDAALYVEPVPLLAGGRVQAAMLNGPLVRRYISLRARPPGPDPGGCGPPGWISARRTRIPAAVCR
jgi:hypothetical protein